MTATIPPPASGLLTYEQYMAEEEIVARYSIVDGVRIFMAGATWHHQRINAHVLQAFTRYEEATGNGYALTAPFDILIQRSPLRTRQPDVLFITHARLQQGGGIPQRGPLQVPPELVVEIISDSETRRIIGEKLADYAAVGVEEIWLLRSETRTIEVLRLASGNYVSDAVYDDTQSVQSLILSKLTIAVTDVFRP